MMKDLQISAIVVGRNEGVKLSKCLQSLSFCNEILYGDLDSSDNSIDIAIKHNCKIFQYKIFGPAGEYTQSDLIKKVSNDWVIIIDPDEFIDQQLANEILDILPIIDQSENIGEVAVPWQFYFGKKRLKGTIWGDNNVKGILVNKNRFEILPITHYGRRLKNGFIRTIIERNGDNVLHHYWMDNLGAFISKHRKYLKDEGSDKFKMGERTTLKNVMYQPFAQFANCFIRRKGYKDGFLGLLLSAFWTWYSTYAQIDLYKITKRKN